RCFCGLSPRRPQITIVAAEPLGSNSWFSGSSVGFPPPQPGSSTGRQPVSQLPPSYDQVIKEKTQEEHTVKPTAAPRRSSCTTTSATQTDPVSQDPATAITRCKKPQKPPRPSLPKPADRKPVTKTDKKVVTNTAAFTNTEDQRDPNQRPVPRPRTKSHKQAIEEEAKVQTLVEISENFEDIQSSKQEVSSNKYLKELLEVFSSDNECEVSSATTDQSDEALLSEDAVGEMNGSNSQSNFQARIQAFESQAANEEGNVNDSTRLQLPARKPSIRPPVAAKPSVSLKPQFTPSIDDFSQNISATNILKNPTTPPRPQPPEKPGGRSIKEESYSVMARGSQVYEEEPSFFPPKPPVKPIKEPLKPNLNINNHNSASMVRDNEYAESLISKYVLTTSKPLNGSCFKINTVHSGSVSLFRFSPSETSSIKCQIVGYFMDMSHSSCTQFLHFRKPSMNKTLPPRPPAAKTAPVRPPQSFKATGRSQSLSWETSPKPQPQKPHRKELVFPPRPSPGHRLYNKYTLQLPHGIASCDYNGSNSGELSFQKNEVLLLLKQINHNEFECQAGQTRGRVHKSRMQIITPLSSDMFPSQVTYPFIMSQNSYGLKVQVVHDFNPEGPGELSLRAGDIVTMVEKVDSEWYRGTCRGSTGFFPINYVKVLGEQSDELSFSEGDVIQLKEYMGQDWARGQIGTHEGIFPLNFVEVIEDLPPPPSQQQSAKMVSQSSVEWVVALYDYNGKTADDLSFREGECILITQHLDDDWSCGRLNGKEGIFPRKYVESVKRRWERAPTL
uniref:Osteoclast-stimulating factor 1 n=1 Tax=Amphilophus citrinellus TaxID=61819 RepID=A0A3Q0SJA8_AMPCI